MNYLLIRQLVADYAQWKEAFDMHLSARQAGGATDELWVLRNVDDPQEIIAVLGWHDLTTARLFVQSISWQMALRQMGVDGLVEVCFLEDVGKPTLFSRIVGMDSAVKTPHHQASSPKGKP